MKTRTSVVYVSLISLIGSAFVAGAPKTKLDVPQRQGQEWVTTWGASPVAPPTTDQGFNNQTLRLIVRISVGGSEARVRLSNVFGSRPLVVGAAHIALSSSGADEVPGSNRALTFEGTRSVTIPPERLAVSDPVAMNVPSNSDVAVSLYFPEPTGPATYHPLALCDNYVATGNAAAAAQFPISRTEKHWFYLTDVEIRTAAHTPAIVAFGDSITDGFRSTPGANHRWPNFLSERLARAGVKLAVVDEGISGNRILHDGAGPSGLSRFERDVLDQVGVKYVIVLLGINDVGQSQRPTEPVTADEIIAGHRQLIARAHDRGLKIFGCTLTPIGGSGYDPPPDEATSPREAMREAVNRFIRSGAYDAVIDLDAAVRDPDHPVRFLPKYDSGDHLHPGDAGYQAMADTIDLSLFRAGK